MLLAIQTVAMSSCRMLSSRQPGVAIPLASRWRSRHRWAPPARGGEKRAARNVSRKAADGQDAPLPFHMPNSAWQRGAGLVAVPAVLLAAWMARSALHRPLHNELIQAPQHALVSMRLDALQAKLERLQAAARYKTLQASDVDEHFVTSRRGNAPCQMRKGEASTPAR